MTQNAFFFHFFISYAKHYEFDLWKKPVENSEEVMETYILGFFFLTCSDIKKTILFLQVTLLIILYVDIRCWKPNLAHAPDAKKSQFSFRRALCMTFLLKVTLRKKNMYDYRLQESSSHLAFKLCNFLTDDWEKNQEAANNKG